MDDNRHHQNRQSLNAKPAADGGFKEGLLTGALALYGSLMLSQAMELVTRGFYGRGDLDLILSSPVAAWRLFAVRIGAMAVTIALTSLALAALQPRS